MENSVCLNMKVEALRGLLNERLTAMVEEICGLFLITVAEYEESLPRSKVEAEQQQRPEVPSPVSSDGGRLHSPEIERVLVIKQEQQQEISISGQNAMEPLYIKKEMEAPESILEGQCLEQPDYPSIFTDTWQVTPTNQSHAKHQEQRYTRKDKTPRPPHCNEDQETPCTLSEDAMGAEGIISSEYPSSSSAQQKEIDGEDSDKAALGSDDVKTSNFSDYDTEDSDDDWNRTPAQRSHLQLTKNAPGSGPNNNLDLKVGTDLQTDSSEPETEDSDDEDWNCRGKLQSGLTTVKPAGGPESSSKSSCQTSFSFSVSGKGFQLRQQVGKKTRSQKAALTQSKLCFAANLSEPSGRPKKLNSPASRKSDRSTSLKRTKELEAKPFRCSVCDQTFKKKAYLVLHMKTHKAERERKTAHPRGSS